MTAVFNPHVVVSTEKFLYICNLIGSFKNKQYGVYVVVRVLLGRLRVAECPLLVALAPVPLLIFTEGGTYSFQTL